MENQARRERALRLKELASMPGWKDVLDMANDHISSNQEYVNDLMVNNPVLLTGKTAIAKANRARGVRDLIEDIEAEAKISQ